MTYTLGRKKRFMVDLTKINAEHKCKKIVVANNKGGCGKTITSFTLANYLYEEKSGRVLVIDTDKQGDLGKQFGVDGSKDVYSSVTLSSVYTGLKNLSDKPFSVLPVRDDPDNSQGPVIDLIPCDPFIIPTTKYAEGIYGEKECCKKISQLIKMYEKFYDYIVFDTTPVIEDCISTKHALTVADCVVVPIDALQAIENINITMRSVLRYCKESTKVLFTFTRYKPDDVQLTNYFELHREKEGLPECLKAVSTMSPKYQHGHDECRNTLYRFIRTVLPNNTCVTGIPHEQKITNNTYFNLDAKYKKLFKNLCLEIVRGMTSPYTENLCADGVWDEKAEKMDKYIAIVRDYRSQGAPESSDEVVF